MSVGFGIARLEFGGQGLQSLAIGVFEGTECPIQLGGALIDQLFQMVFVALLCDNQLMMLESPSHRGFCLTEVEGLHQIIERPQTWRVDGALDCLHSANHYDECVWAC